MKRFTILLFVPLLMAAATQTPSTLQQATQLAFQMGQIRAQQDELAKQFKALQEQFDADAKTLQALEASASSTVKPGK